MDGSQKKRYHTSLPEAKFYANKKYGEKFIVPKTIKLGANKDRVPSKTFHAHWLTLFGKEMTRKGFQSREECEKYARCKFEDHHDSTDAIRKDPSTGLVPYGSRPSHGGLFVCWVRGLDGMELKGRHVFFSSP